MSELQAEILDQKKLDQLRYRKGEPNPELFQKVVCLFLEQMSHLLQELLQTTEQGDNKAAAEISHTLKSSSGTVGANGLMSLCKQIELSCDQGQMDIDLICSIQDVCKDVESALKKELDVFV